MVCKETLPFASFSVQEVPCATFHLFAKSWTLILSTVFEYAITHTHTGNSILFPGLEQVWSQRSKSRCSWVWHPQFRILDGKTSFGSVPGLFSSCSCQPSHFMTKDSGVCPLCWAETPPPKAAWEVALHHGREIFDLLQEACRGE